MVDGIGPLDAGVNTGLAPQLLPSNQVAMSTNMTFRGGYGNHRPSLREISLDFKGDLTTEELCIHRAFQGACFYQPDTGAQSLVAAIGGHLFQFFPSGTTAQVLDVSVPGDPNPTNPQQAWLWQSERFVIWNDGVSLPVFFDGSISRRSNGNNNVLATIVGSYVAPAVGASVSVTVTEPYSGPFNIPVIVNGNQFTLLQTQANVHSATVFPIYDPANSHAIGEPIISYPNRVGTLLSDIPAGVDAVVAIMSTPNIQTNQIIQIGDVQFKIGLFGPGPTVNGYPTLKVNLVVYVPHNQFFDIGFSAATVVTP